MPESLQQLVAKVPVAEHGAPITVNLHNTLRDVLVLLASQGLVGPGTGARTVSLAPAFIEFGGGPNWVNLDGMATVPGGGVAEGWLPVQLPDGAVIDSMIVKGQRTGNMDSFQVRLRYIPLDPSEQARAPVRIDDLATATSPFDIERPVSIPGLSGAALLDARTVKNDSRSYFVWANAIYGTNANAEAKIHSVQVKYTLGAQ